MATSETKGQGWRAILIQ